MKRACAWIALLACADAPALDYTAAYALQTPDGEHAGAVLAAPDFTVDHGDCVFSLMPAQARGLASPLGVEIARLKARGELHWARRDGAIVIGDDTHTLLTIAADGGVVDAGGATIGTATAMPEVE